MSKILHVNGGGDLGGGKSHLVSLLPRLRKMGYDVELLVFTHGVLSRECADAGVPVHCLNHSMLISPGLLVALRSFLCATRPAIVHTHGGRASFYGRLAAASARVGTVVTTVHSHARLDHESTWKNIVFSLADKLTRPLTRQFISVSQQLTNELVRQGINPDRLKVIPNGIGECAGQPVERDQLSKAEFIICSIGRFAQIKGFDVLLDAVAILSQRGFDFRLVLIGDGPESGTLKEMAVELSIADRVDFMGYVHNACSFLYASDVLVLSSRMEGLPIVLLEAMAAMLPVVSSAVGGVPEIVTHEENGLLVPPEDPLALADAIQRVLHDRDFARKLGVAGRRWYERYGTADRMAEQTARCYEELGYVRE